MLPRRNYLALDVDPRELRAVSLRRKGRGCQLTGARTLPLDEGILGASLREPNVLDRHRFVQALREVLVPLAGREERIALSLPETFGRVLLTEVETAFRNREEGVKILKWQLKKSLPAETAEIVLDFQPLGLTEDGRHRVMVAFVGDGVLAQLEEIFDEIGLFLHQVDFHSLNLFNFYRPRLNLAEDFSLVGIEDGAVSLQFFQDGAPAFHRVRYGLQDTGAMFQELHRSVAGCRDKFPAFPRAAVYLHSTRKDPEIMVEALAAVFEREALLFHPHLERLAPEGAAPAPDEGGNLAAAIGAAERMIWRPE